MFTTQSHCEVGTIPQIHSRLLQEGFHVSEYALRIWVKQGLLPLSLPATAPHLLRQRSPRPHRGTSPPGTVNQRRPEM